jgi:hypothetical protein
LEKELMIKLSLPPTQASYKVTDGDEVIANKLDGGASRYRRDILGSTSIVVVQWNCHVYELNYIRAFFRSITKHGSEPFLVDLVLNSVNLTEHTAYFIPGTMQLTCLGGPNYAVSAQLEVVPDEADAAYDEAYVGLWNSFGEAGIGAGLLSLEHLVNIDLAGVSPE